jgi:hypothetical protein
MVPKCVVPKESVIALCVTLCNAHSFRAKINVERNEREKDLFEKVQKLSETILIV